MRTFAWTVTSFFLATFCLIVPVRADEAEDAAKVLEGKGAKLERDRKTKDKPVIGLDLSKAMITDEDLADVAKFEWLETLDLSDTPITDAGLRRLLGLKKLHKIDLTHTNTYAALGELEEKLPELMIAHPLASLAGSAKGRSEAEQKALALLARFDAECKADNNDPAKPIISVTLRETVVPDALIEALPSLPALRELSFVQCPLTDSKLDPLAKLEKLTELSLYDCGLRDKSLASLKGLKQLRSLSVAYNALTDEGLAELKELEQLQKLVLYHTGITDGGLSNLTSLGKLEVLSLASTAVTDAAIDSLKKLTALREISLADTKVTPEGVKSLRQSLPSAKVRN